MKIKSDDLDRDLKHVIKDIDTLRTKVSWNNCSTMKLLDQIQEEMKKHVEVPTSKVVVVKDDF